MVSPPHEGISLESYISTDAVSLSPKGGKCTGTNGVSDTCGGG